MLVNGQPAQGRPILKAKREKAKREKAKQARKVEATREQVPEPGPSRPPLSLHHRHLGTLRESLFQERLDC